MAGCRSGGEGERAPGPDDLIPRAADSSCCEPSAEPGCEDAGCQAAVCALDAFCCAAEWDELCVQAAQDVCGDACAMSGPCCEANGSPGCGDAACEAVVCAADGFCCASEWDGLCAAQAQTSCPELCDAPDDGPCCENNGTPGCDDDTCEAAVCALDDWCCSASWDGVCAGMAATECGALCAGESLSCCDAHAMAGCDDEACETTVCAADPFCCSSSWDALCVQMAEDSCGETCAPCESWYSEVAFRDVSSATAATTDADGNVYLTGATRADDEVQWDVVVAKLDPAGAVLWTHEFGAADPIYDVGEAITVDGAGDVIVASWYQDSVASYRDPTTVLTKLDADGNVLWTRELATTSGGILDGIIPAGLTTDADDNVIVTGRVRGAVDGVQSAGLHDGFVTKLDPAGNSMWLRMFGTAGIDGAGEVAVDSEGDIIVVGHAPDSFEGHPHVGDNDVIVYELDPNGDLNWSTQLGTPQSDAGATLALGPGDEILVGALSYGDFVGDGGIGSSKPVVLLLDATGALQWAREPGGGQFDGVPRVAFDGADAVVAGHDGIWPNADLYAIRYDGDGVELWSHLGQDDVPTALNGLALSPSGQPIAVGQSSDTFHVYVTTLCETP